MSGTAASPDLQQLARLATCGRSSGELRELLFVHRIGVTHGRQRTGRNLARGGFAVACDFGATAGALFASAPSVRKNAIVC